MYRKKDRKLPIGIGMPFDLLEEIDTKRGEKSRSEFVVHLIKEALQMSRQVKSEREREKGT